MTDKTLVERMSATIGLWYSEEDYSDWREYQRDHLEAKNTINALQARVNVLEAALADARSFIDEDSPDWRHAKQAQLAAIDAALEGEQKV